MIKPLELIRVARRHFESLEEKPIAMAALRWTVSNTVKETNLIDWEAYYWLKQSPDGFGYLAGVELRGLRK